jgi:nucleoside-diphosphate-sugar epimerase
MKIIILGASGQIGSIVFDALQHRHDVTGTSRKPSPKYVQFDPFRDDWSLLGKADVVVNCIGQIGATSTSSFAHIHVGLTKLIIRNRTHIGNPRIIQLSALGASTTHNVEFLKTKGMADEILLQHPDTFIVRPSIVCTHGTMIVRKMLMLNRIVRYTGGLLIVPGGFLTTRIQPVMPQDLADVVQALCVTTGYDRVVNVVGPHALSFREIIAVMFKTTDKKFRLIEVPGKIVDVIALYGICLLFPSVINTQQYRLLFEDNVADPAWIIRSPLCHLFRPCWATHFGDIVPVT